MRFYENVENIHQNREKPRSYYIPYETLEKALKGDKHSSENYLTLNGIWKFGYFKNEAYANYDAELDGEIYVPSNWQNYGYDKHCYTNVNYPFPVDPPYVPDINPCGIYETKFNFTDFELSKEVYLNFDGINSCGYIYINSRYVGFTTGSHLTSEFNITNYVAKGENTVRVKVLKWCFDSYFEDQDDFRFSGIFRDFYLLFRNKNHLNDIEVTTKDHKIYSNIDSFTIYDEELNKVNNENLIEWNAEKPYLYTVVFEHSGEFIPVKAGVREIKISENSEHLINGTAVKLKGINHHDNHPVTGQYLYSETIKGDLSKMKSLNINAIRTSHYPPTSEFLELCDEMGFYVIEEADIESHGFLTRWGKGNLDVHNNDWIRVMTPMTVILKAQEFLTCIY